MSLRTRFAALAALTAAGAIAAAGATAATHASSVSTKPCGQDINWLKTSAQGDVFEIDGGRMAQQKSANTTVQALGKRLQSDHTKSLVDANKLAKKYGIKLEATPTPSEVWELNIVNSLSGSTFDTWYTSLEVYDHHQDIQETNDEVKLGCNAQIVGDAKQELPMLKTHLQLSQQANAAVGGDTK
ncbi:MAG: DUF4142 domain-containing protein [Actinobacteria bacterium]|nr:DUF4142 domain-containing protein [Actinomycetota bacterium]MBV8563299.1 DUF4142 domain-containing protein [Actinomycetota bacterium]